MQMWQKAEVKVTALFVVLLAVYLLTAYLFLEPLGYYGSAEVPRFADPWLDRSAVILNGGLLYRDTFTATPPLTNYLLLPPSIIAINSGRINPVSTAAFMIYFSLFNLFAAWLLLRMVPDRRAGLTVAVLYLLNPLTFGNTVWRRQDESVLVFFFGIGLLFLLHQRHTRAAIAIGVALLVKLTALLLLPIAVLHSRFKWPYFVLPPAVFLLAWSPFYFMAGRPAMFWDFNQQHTQHPFQLGGISLGSLWNRISGNQGVEISVTTLTVIFLGASFLIGLFILWQRAGILADLTLWLAVVLVFVPKLHAGYFSLLAFVMVLLIRTKVQIGLYLLFGALIIAVDLFKWPIENFPAAFWLMVFSLTLLTGLVVDLYLQARKQAAPVSLMQWFFPARPPAGD